MDHAYTAAVQEFIRVNGLWLIPFFPAMGALINLVFGAMIQKRWGKAPIHTVAVGTMVLSSLTALYFFLGKLLWLDPSQRFLLDEVFPMIDIGAVRVMMAFAMDPLGGVMAVMVTVVATAIHIYSTGYMHDEPSYWRFFGYLNLFCFSMLMLVLGDNFILMFFGWEGVGLCSYLLIGFWYKDRQKAACGMKAFVVNRIGDFGFIVGLFTLFWGLLGMWDSVPGEMAAVDKGDGRCVPVMTKPMPQKEPAHAHGDKAGHGGAHGALPAPQAALMASLTKGIIGTAHAADPKAGGHDKRARGGRQLGRCGERVKGQRFAVQGAVAVGQARQVYVGPTVSFRELRDQLAIEDKSGKRVIALSLSQKKLQFRLTKWLGGGVIAFPLLMLVTFGFFLGATGKSAQIPLYTWLPDAMAGPTPVSALIHAATMVTAGVYMVARLNFIFQLSPHGMTAVALVGGLTALFAATIGLFQYDIKKVLAYSTVSQLGYMFVGVGVGAYWVGIYHLLTHAFFKACLFLGSGSVIHGMHYVEHAHGHGHGEGGDKPRPSLRFAPDPADPQDMRNMGGLAKLMPSTRTTYLIACLAISGVPLFSGFYSKDEILWKAFANPNLMVPGWLIWAMCAVGAVCTAFYMFRSYYMTFYGRPPTEDHVKHVHESPRSMTWVLWFLAIGAVAISLIGSVFFVPAAIFHKTTWIESFLAPSTAAISDRFQGFWLDKEWMHNVTLEYGLMALSVVLAAVGIFGARFWYKDIAKTRDRMEWAKTNWRFIHRTVFNKYFVDEIYNATVVRGFMAISRGLAWFDLRVVDGLVNATSWGLRSVAAFFGAVDYKLVDGAVNGVADTVIGAGRRVRRVQSGRINAYVMGVAFGVVFLLFVVWFVGPQGR
jgi:NADH-quinone oxidoreductase subunit L